MKIDSCALAPVLTEIMLDSEASQIERDAAEEAFISGRADKHIASVLMGWARRQQTQDRYGK